MSIRPSKQACVQQVRPCKPSVALRSPRTSYSIARGSICHERSCESAASSEMSVGADLEATDDAGVVGPERDEPSAIVFQLCFIRRVPLIYRPHRHIVHSFGVVTRPNECTKEAAKSMVRLTRLDNFTAARDHG